MTVTYHNGLIQGSDEWHQARCGLITASEMKLLLTAKTCKIAENEKKRAHMWELTAQRISGYVEPTYIGDEMLRGHEDEIEARNLYRKHIGPVEECGFVTNDKWGFTLGCSPDGLVGDDGLIECKSRRQKFQVQAIVEHWVDGTVPEEFMLQVQTAMLVTERRWCDLISFSGGLPMAAMRVEPNAEMQAAILEASAKFEAGIAEAIANYHAALGANALLIPTERRVEEEMFV